MWQGNREIWDVSSFIILYFLLNMLWDFLTKRLTSEERTWYGLFALLYVSVLGMRILKITLLLLLAYVIFSFLK